MTTLTRRSALALAATATLAAQAKKPLSAASRRALAYTKGPEWFCTFRQEPVQGDLVYNEGVHRRDPSAVLLIDGLYHVWYTKSSGPSAGFDNGDHNKKVWHATSPDARTWKEQGLAVGRGPAGAFDDRSVFTPEVLAHNGRYYLVYQVVQYPYRRRSLEHVALAHADSPNGPWTKLPKPILSPSNDGEWLGTDDNRFLVKSRGSFDSHKTHDPCLVVRNGKFWLYYKGEIMGESMTYGGREIAWGVAVAEKIEGPYAKSPYNPVTNSGHEVAVWPYKGGVAALLTTDGVEKDTIQYAPDGVNFEIMAHIKNPPQALGLFRTPDPDKGPLEGLRWGLCHAFGRGGWGFIQRYEVDERNKMRYLRKENYE
jgi:hypothetical protein